MVARVFLAACILGGAMMCFWGHRLFRLVLGIVGGLVGGYAAAAAGFILSEGSMTAAIVTGVLGAILGAVLMVTTYLLAVFAIGAGLGSLIAMAVTVGQPQSTQALVIASAGVVGGLLALLLKRPLMIIATALNGAALCVAAGWLLLTNSTPLPLLTGDAPRPKSWLFIVLLAAWTLLGCFGAYVQFAARGRTVVVDNDSPARDEAGEPADQKPAETEHQL
jgi:hypothetical protein